ncbi:MAG: hypothetical protein M1838_000715 [Thelocarpon superellum]|nr:MAG: hypothetical protein M1838_000715 [Thelocarpon superellum]
MAIGKGIGGYVFHSQALIADAIHSLTDLLSDFMTLATVSLSVKPPSATFPSGYGKIESLGSVGVSGMLLVGGLLMGWNACEVLYSQLFLDAAAAAEHLSHGHGHGHGHGHSHSHMDLGPNINAIWIVGGSIVVKEYLYRATMKIALERKSSVLASNAVHHRVDSLSSIVALVAIAGANFFSNAAWLDPVGGLLVSLMVIRAGWSNTGAALLELADVAVDSDIRDSVRRAAEGCLVPERLTILLGEASVGQVAVRDVQGVKSGQNYLMELQLAVPGSCSVSHLQTLETLVREAVAASVRGVRRVKIRFVASETASTDFKAEFIGIDEPADLASTEKKHE